MEARNRSGRYLRATRDLVEQFFVIEQENIFGDSENEMQNEEPMPTEAESTDNNDLLDDDESDSSSEELPVKIIDDLYLQLREAHRQNGPINNYSDEHIQHKDLRPRLTHYQIDGVKWMLQREQIIDHFPTEFKEVCRRWPDTGDTVKFYYNERTMVLVVNKNDDIQIPSGGVLADAMGLGKTVEMLDLILLNPRQDCEQQRYFVDLSRYEFEDDPDYLRCLCAKKSLIDTVRCTRCYMLQHRLCVSQFNSTIAPDTQYICPTCWQTEEPLKAKTTFIVSPPSIKLQWRDEVINHISNENFKVSV